MVEDRYLIIACDDHKLLQSILNATQDLKGVKIILASRITDLLSIIKSSDPELIIICFRHTQRVINDIKNYYPENKIPLLCLVKKYQTEKLRWHSEDIVFTHMLEPSSDSKSLYLRVNAILLLRRQSKKHYTALQSGSGLTEMNILRSSKENLARHVMELDQKNRTLNRIKNRLEKIYEHANEPVKQKLLSVINSIRSNSRDTKVWTDFKSYFNQIDPQFIKQLKVIHPDLTSMDVKYCCYLKMNMSNEEIRCIFGISLESVRTHKYRLKKKLELMKNQNLQSYLMTIPGTNPINIL